MTRGLFLVPLAGLELTRGIARTRAIPGLNVALTGAASVL